MATKKQTGRMTSETPRQDAFDAAWEKYRPLVPEDELPALEESLHKPLLQAFRLNPLKTDGSALEGMSSRYGWNLEPSAFCPEGSRVRSAQTLPSMTNEHRMGYYYIQDSASMMPVMLYDTDRLQDSPLILDLAASPGGKTTHLISRSLDKGPVVANDSSASRIPALKTVLKTWGSISHAITQFPGESYGDWFPNTFDLILLDAPCSMQSLVSLDSHPMRPITEREEKALAQRQTALLKSALKALRPGGQIVYSTCTLSPDEDEAVVDAILKVFHGKVHVADAAERIPWPAPGLTEAYGKEYDSSVRGAVRLWPHRYETAGFFACLLDKDDYFDTEPGIDRTDAPYRSWEKSSFASVKASDMAELSAWLKDQFGLSLMSLCETPEAVIMNRGNEFWMLPQRYIETFSTLPSKSVGMRLATKTTGGFVPDNDWICRFFSQTEGSRFIPDPEQQIQWLNGADIRPDSVSLSRGTMVMIQDDHGVFLGCGRVSADRIRNFNK